jgi:diguanylate cyclase (GGDEF)-like protein
MSSFLHMLGRRAPAPEHSESRYRYCLDVCLRALGSLGPSRIAIAAAAIMMALVGFTGALDPLERRLSDAWFRTADIAPSGRIILVTFDRGSARYANAPRLPRRDLADLMTRLDAAGASRILIDVGLGDPANEADDRALERALDQLGRKAALLAAATRAGNQTSWRRTGPLDRFARHVARTASDLAPDGDGKLRTFGIEASALRPLPSSAVWLAGVGRERNGTPAEDIFRIDYSIDLHSIPVIDAASLLQGAPAAVGLSGTGVIVSSFWSASNFGFQVPRRGELIRPQIEALAAETLLLGRNLQPLPRLGSSIGLTVLAALIGLLCTRLGATAGAGIGLCVIAGAAAAAAQLQTSIGLIAPAAGAMAAVLLGYATARLAAFRPVRHAVTAAMAGIDIEALRRVASQDPLTGLSNRRIFEEALGQACLRARGQFALLICDLDGFKQVNDTVGHAAGDTLLREVAARLAAAAGPDGVVARLGGDEFGILLEPSSRQLAAEVATRALTAIARPVLVADQPVSVSIGIALGAPQQSMRDLMESADAAMYGAKRSRTGYRFGGGERPESGMALKAEHDPEKWIPVSRLREALAGPVTRLDASAGEGRSEKACPREGGGHAPPRIGAG